MSESWKEVIEIVQILMVVYCIGYLIWLAYDLGHYMGYDKGSQDGWKERAEFERDQKDATTVYVGKDQ